MGFDFKSALQNKLTSKEYNLASPYIERAQDYYNADKDSAAREALLDAIAVCAAAGENNAAGKIQAYLKYC